MSELAIQVDNLSKQYRIGLQEKKHDTVMSAILSWLRSPWDNFRQLRRLSTFNGKNEADVLWALKDVSFTVQQGEVIGIIGRNGAGKSTLLKILSRITPPSTGRIVLNGRVASLLEVGTGFHPDLTGRENIYLNGTILGMTKAEVDRKFAEILDFSGVEKFIDTPVKRYSSGMKVRLAFSVAAHLEPEILIIDEVLAVGDAEFQRRCLGKMKDVATSGRTVLFVSHDMPAIQNLCTTCYLLEAGRITLSGNTASVVGSYLRQSQSAAADGNLQTRQDRSGNGVMRFKDVQLLDAQDQLIQVAQLGAPLTIKLDYDLHHPNQQNAVIRLMFTNDAGQKMFMCLSRNSHDGVVRLTDEGQIRCHIPKLPLMPGRYTVGVWCKLGEVMADDIENAFVLEVISGDFFGTGKLNPDMRDGLLVEHFWSFERTNVQ